MRMKTLAAISVLSALIALLGVLACGPLGGESADDGSSVAASVEALTTACRTCSTVTPVHPVILIHGRNDTKARFDTLVANWTTRGYTEGTNLFRLDLTAYCGANSFCAMLPAYSSGATYVNETYARCLSAYIDSVVPCTGETCPTVDIVSHSQGGVVARYYTRFIAPAHTPVRVVDDMVNMASPGGNGITNCTLAGACAGVNPEDCPDSAFMRVLNGVGAGNDETPGGAYPGPIHYDVVVSDGDTTVPPWCSGFYILNPDTRHGGNMSCKTPNYTLDTGADSCRLSKVLHLVVPTNSTAISHAYCSINSD